MLFQSQFPLEFENSHIREESLLDKVFSYFSGESEILWIRFKVLAIYIMLMKKLDTKPEKLNRRHIVFLPYYYSLTCIFSVEEVKD